MKVEMQFFGYFFSASAKKVRELKIMSFFHRLKCLDKLNYSSPRFGYDPKSTQSGVPWILVWKGEKATKSEAKSLERKLKNLSVKRTIEFILKYDEGVPSSDELLLLQKLSEH